MWTQILQEELDTSHFTQSRLCQIPHWLRHHIYKLSSPMGIQATMEAEYITLSQAMRNLIPILSLLDKISLITKLNFGTTNTYSSMV
jgi:hypothetical protein